MATAELRKSDLTPRQFKLVTEMQRIRFGCIERQLVRDGKPVFVPGVTRTVRTILIEGTNDPHPAAGDADTVLKAKVVKLLRHLERVGDGLVRVLQINDGLPPRTVDVEESPSDEFGFAGATPPPPTRPPRMRRIIVVASLVLAILRSLLSMIDLQFSWQTTTTGAQSRETVMELHVSFNPH